MRKILLFTMAICAVFFSSNCRKKKTNNLYTEQIAKIVSEVTNNKISCEDKIYVRFVNPVIASGLVSQEIKEKLFEFSPSITGKTYWKDTKTLIFEPEKKLPFRQAYDGELDLQKLSEDFRKTKAPKLLFSFEVAGREVSSIESELVLKSRDNPVLLNCRCNIVFTEKTDFEDLKNSVSLKVNSSNVNLTWNKGNDEKTFSFESDDIVRDNTTKNIVLTVEKGKLDISDEITKKLQLPPLSNMTVVNIEKIEEGRSPKLQIEFSDEFDPEQDINGLVTIEPKTEIKLQKLGKTLVIDGGFRFGAEYKIIFEKGIRSRWATELQEKSINTIKFSDIKPQVEFSSDGVILPDGNNYKLQFNTANLKRVHLEIKKVYDNSIAQFLEAEQLSSLKDRKTSFNGNYINRVGVIVHNETFEISNEKNNWLLSEIDLSNVVKANNNCMLLIRLNFNTRDCLTDIPGEPDNYIEEFGQIYKPILFSNIGLTCKRADDYIHVYATDLNTCKPLSGVLVDLNYLYSDNQTLESKTSDSNGEVVFGRSDSYNCYIEATKDGQRSVIKFNEMEWNISGFDIGGIDEYQQETKAFIFTERGVYRPGDDMNICVIARNEGEDYPENHQITMELINPQGKKVYNLTNKVNKDGFYNFHFQTKESDLTGNWNAQFYIGNKQFSQQVKIETVVPYKLKVKIEPSSRILTWTNNVLKFDVVSTYLFGNPASEMPVEVSMEISEVAKRFPKYEKFTFTNPALDFKEIQKDIFSGQLDNTGKTHIEWNIPEFTDVPSALNIKLTAKVIEKGGRPNINWIDIPYNPYSHYVGLQYPEYYYLATGVDAEIPVIIVDNDGNAASNKTIKYRIYRNLNYWWWQYDAQNKLRFKSDKNTLLIKEGKIVTQETHSKIRFLPVEKGSYLIEAVDEGGTGHSAGIIINAYPYGGAESGDKNAGTLPLHSEKGKYNVGEVANIKFPSPPNGTVLFTIEKENKILLQKWYYPEDTKGGFTIPVSITKEMVPNAYVSVSLLQPHSQTVNDRPIRMFGILPLLVEDKDTKHEIEIISNDVFRPKAPFSVTLQTKDRRPTQYTIAVVDEGLLDLTQFRTPDPWRYFFQKSRLKVKTYDLFSAIISANKGDVFKTFSIGGDEAYRQSQLKPEKGKRRFKPVCLFEGPLMTDQQGKATATFNMPEYVGSVRIMVIGARGNSYAQAEKTVPVKSELMVLGTLPRVVGPGEKFVVPLSIFAMQDNIGPVSVEIKTSGPIAVIGNKTQQLSFDKASDKDCFFNLATFAKTGQSKVEAIAKSAKYSATYTVDLMVRPSSPRIYSNSEATITPGQKGLLSIPGNGIEGTNEATLTVSKFPVVNFSQRLKWLIAYPYGCIEQTTSKIFSQLYLKKFIEYPDAYSQEIDNNINEGIQRLRTFQLFSGGFSYWPYEDRISDWGTLYAGHFMVEAKKLGYYIEEDLYSNWINFAKQQANNADGDLFTRVYRAYILALSGNAVLSEMNLLKESELSKMDNTQKWLLAATYQLAGLPDKVTQIIKNTGYDTKDYTEFSKTFGSGLRDKAMILDAMVVLKKFDLADKLTSTISKELAASTWYSSQTIGYSLVALGKYVNELNKGQENVLLTGYIILPDGSKINFSTNKSYSLEIKSGFGKQAVVILEKNSSTKRAYTSLSWNGVPLKSNIIDENKNLALSVDWYDDNGSEIDPSELKQGTTFWGHFHVENTSNLASVEKIALVQMLPSGWEIENTRLLKESRPEWTNKWKLNYEEYSDIQDDRIMWFFDLYNYSPINNSLDFMVKLNAVTVGEFDLPGTITEAMYNGSFKATKAGKRVIVVKP